MKKKRQSIRISFGVSAIFYPILLVVALIFAQLIKGAVSLSFFIFTLILPLLSLLELTTARFFISARLRISDNTVKKNGPLRVFLHIKNRSLLPFTLLRTTLYLPDDSGIFCSAHRIFFSLLPMSDCHIERNVRFRLRGQYEIGLSELTVTDLLRAVRLTVPMSISEKLLVLPRQAELIEKELTNSDAIGTSKSKHNEPKTEGEPENIREYIPGDSPKQIHWKLSLKSEEILVKEFYSEESMTVRVICDLEAHTLNTSDNLYTTEDEIHDLELSDLAIEGSLAVCRRELSAGRDVLLALVDGDTVKTALIRSREELFSRIFEIAAVKPSPEKNHLKKICDSFDNFMGYSVFVTAFLQEDTANEMTLQNKEVNELIFCREKGSEAIEPKLRERLHSLGIKLTELDIS